MHGCTLSYISPFVTDETFRLQIRFIAPRFRVLRYVTETYCLETYLFVESDPTTEEPSPADPEDRSDDPVDRSEPEPTYAGCWKRFTAALIDFVIVLLSSIVLGIGMGIVYALVFRTDSGVETMGRILGTLYA